jgi:flotillin
MWGWIIVVVVGLALTALVVWALLKNYRNVGPNEALVVSGLRAREVRGPDGKPVKIGYRLQIGGGTLVWPYLESASVLPLDVYALTIKVSDVLTKAGVQLSAEATGFVKVKGDEDSIRVAAEHFLSRGSEGIISVGHDVLEGCMRAVLGARTVEQIYQDRDGFSEKVTEAAEADLAKMGLEVLSFSLKDLSDKQGYLEALGTESIARVKRDALIIQAESDKEASIRSAVARKDGDIARLKAESEIAQATRDFESNRAEFQAAVNQKRAQADAAYELERLKLTASIKENEYDIRLIEKKKSIELEQSEIQRREKELEATVKRPAEAMAYQQKLEADSEAYKKELDAKGKAAGIRLYGNSEAEAILAKGKAEAEAMSKRADSFARYNQAATLQMIVERLPEIARAISEPMAKIDKIVMVGSSKDGGNATALPSQVASLVAQIPTVVESLTGVDIKALIPHATVDEDKKAT